MVRITHPFHPLAGREIELMCRRLHWGDDRIAYRDEAGRLCWIAADLTDVDPPDDYQRVAAGAQPSSSTRTASTIRRASTTACSSASRAR
jgi:hypothetical protein